MYPGERRGVGQRVNYSNWKPNQQCPAAAAQEQYVDTSGATRANPYVVSEAAIRAKMAARAREASRCPSAGPPPGRPSGMRMPMPTARPAAPCPASASASRPSGMRMPMPTARPAAPCPAAASAPRPSGMRMPMPTSRLAAPSASGLRPPAPRAPSGICPPSSGLPRAPAPRAAAPCQGASGLRAPAPRAPSGVSPPSYGLPRAPAPCPGASSTLRPPSAGLRPPSAGLRPPSSGLRPPGGGNRPPCAQPPAPVSHNTSVMFAPSMSPPAPCPPPQQDARRLSDQRRRYAEERRLSEESHRLAAARAQAQMVADGDLSPLPAPQHFETEEEMQLYRNARAQAEMLADGQMSPSAMPQYFRAQHDMRRVEAAARLQAERLAMDSPQQPPRVPAVETTVTTTTTKRLVPSPPPPPPSKGARPKGPLPPLPGRGGPSAAAGRKKKKVKEKEKPMWNPNTDPNSTALPVVAVPVEVVKPPSLASFAPPLRSQRAAASKAAAEAAAAAAAVAEAQRAPCPAAQGAAPADEPTVAVPVASVGDRLSRLREIMVPLSVANSPEETIVSVSRFTGRARVLDLGFEKDFGPTFPSKMKKKPIPAASQALGQFMCNLEEADRLERRELGDAVENIQRNRRRFLFLGLENEMGQIGDESQSHAMWNERLRAENIRNSPGLSAGRGCSRLRPPQNAARIRGALEDYDDLMGMAIPLVNSDDELDERGGVAGIRRPQLFLESSSSGSSKEELLPDLRVDFYTPQAGIRLSDEALPFDMDDDLLGSTACPASAASGGVLAEECQEDLLDFLQPLDGGGPILETTTTTSRTTTAMPGDNLIDWGPPEEKPSEQLFRLVKIYDLEY